MLATVCDCSLQTPPSGHGEQIVSINDGGAPPRITLSFSPQFYFGVSIIRGAFLNPLLGLDYGEHQY
ncbi:hypothetical protein D8674_029695 [Pyrus ussuriensis x Pyrus communis]|uniref:Uncharacterized protein n=1 Tax=Pyrus ussuriensis x Pyrus communis TaxID=2448454 RepID=A0A5N5I0Z6_9ROSA|nr:hypothetical protein D8674_029695 [Pyrus ussuriensis x Pyrus communis]